MSTTEAHKILGVPEDAVPEEVERAFKVLAQIYHPDRFESSSEAVRSEALRRMQQVTWAHQELGGGGVTVSWEVDGWTNSMRGNLTTELLDREVPHRWDGEELTVVRQYEQTVDSLLDTMCEDS
jgi:hypothetical protein